MKGCAAELKVSDWQMIAWTSWSCDTEKGRRGMAVKVVSLFKKFSRCRWRRSRTLLCHDSSKCMLCSLKTSSIQVWPSVSTWVRDESRSRSSSLLTENTILLKLLTLLYIQAHLVNAVGSWKLSCLCLLDIFATLGILSVCAAELKVSDWQMIAWTSWSCDTEKGRRGMAVKVDSTVESKDTEALYVPAPAKPINWHISCTKHAISASLIGCFRSNTPKSQICPKMNICLKKKSLISKRPMLYHKHQQLERHHSSQLKQRKKKVKMMILRVMEVTYMSDWILHRFEVLCRSLCSSQLWL